MTRDVDSLVLCMRALLCDEMFHLDTAVPPIPFNEEVMELTQEAATVVVGQFGLLFFLNL